MPASMALGLYACMTVILMLCREAFDLFDTDGSGTIDAKELKVAMRYVCCWRLNIPLCIAKQPASSHLRPARGSMHWHVDIFRSNAFQAASQNALDQCCQCLP